MSFNLPSLCPPDLTLSCAVGVGGVSMRAAQILEAKALAAVQGPQGQFIPENKRKPLVLQFVHVRVVQVRRTHSLWRWLGLPLMLLGSARMLRYLLPFMFPVWQA